MDVSEASECAKTIGAKHTIPYHMEAVKDKMEMIMIKGTGEVQNNNQ